MKNFLYSLIAGSLLFVSTVANSAMLDFTDGTFSEGYISSYDFGGGLVMFMESTGGNVYYDAHVGFGVCSAQDCSSNSDDNLAYGESITFTFQVGGFDAEAEGLMFTINNDHGAGLVDVDIDTNAGNWDVPNGATASSGTLFSALYSSWTFTPTEGSGELYIDSVSYDSIIRQQSIPEPSTLALLALALIGIVASRKKLVK